MLVDVLDAGYITAEAIYVRRKQGEEARLAVSCLLRCQGGSFGTTEHVDHSSKEDWWCSLAGQYAMTLSDGSSWPMHSPTARRCYNGNGGDEVSRGRPTS